MSELAELFAQVVSAGGAPAAISAGIVVGLALAVIAIGRLIGFSAAARIDGKTAELQASLVDMVKALTATEQALRLKIDQLQADKLGLADEVLALRASLACARTQRRRLLEVLREVKYGQLGPEAVRAAAVELLPPPAPMPGQGAAT